LEIDLLGSERSPSECESCDCSTERQNRGGLCFTSSGHGESTLHETTGLSKHDDEDDEDWDGRVSFDGVHVFVTEESDSESDEGDNNDSDGFR